MRDSLFSTLAEENPLQIVGAINAYAALQAQAAGFKAIYLSGAGVANASFGLPDLGLTTLAQVCEDIRRIRGVCALPLLVDADTGWGNTGQAVRELCASGASGCHIEDQVEAKRCGHRPGKVLVSAQEMVDRMKRAVDARPYAEFTLMARTDAFAVEGMDGAIDRASLAVEAGADMVFIEALPSLEDYQTFTRHISVPVLANITEFGQTPLFPKGALAKAGVQLILYPLSAFRAMAYAAESVYQSIRSVGTQAGMLQAMQTRDDLYRTLDYEAQERKIDAMLNQNKDEPS